MYEETLRPVLCFYPVICQLEEGKTTKLHSQDPWFFFFFFMNRCSLIRVDSWKHTNSVKSSDNSVVQDGQLEKKIQGDCILCKHLKKKSFIMVTQTFIFVLIFFFYFTYAIQLVTFIKVKVQPVRNSSHKYTMMFVDYRHTCGPPIAKHPNHVCVY